jgi:hypothetical protein
MTCKTSTITRPVTGTTPISINLLVDGSPVDLTNADFVYMIYRKTSGLITLTGVVDTDPKTGSVTFDPSSSEVDEVGEFDYYVKVIWANGDIQPFNMAKINFTEIVT